MTLRYSEEHFLRLRDLRRLLLLFKIFFLNQYLPSPPFLLVELLDLADTLLSDLSSVPCQPSLIFQLYQVLPQPCPGHPAAPQHDQQHGGDHTQSPPRQDLCPADPSPDLRSGTPPPPRGPGRR